MPDTVCVGIDFGAKRSHVGFWDGNLKDVVVLVCEPEEGHRHLPTFANFATKGKVEVGSPAERNYNNGLTISFAKQLIGKTFDSATEIQVPTGHPEPKIIDGKPCFELPNGITVTPDRVYIEILKCMKGIIVKRFPKSKIKAVITVPAEAKQEYREIIKEGAEKQFGEVALVDAPNAAAVAYSTKIDFEDGKNIVVIDIGAASTEISITTFETLNLKVQKSSFNDICGSQFDDTIVKQIIAQLNPPDGDENAFESLVRQEWLKKMRSLQEHDSIDIQIPDKPLIKITRENFRTLTRDSLEEISGAIRTLMNGTSFDASDIQYVALVGGYARIPGIIDVVTSHFNESVIIDQIIDHPNLDIGEVPVYGATRYANQLFGDKDEDAPELLPNAARNVGLQTFGGSMTPFITDETPIPTAVKRMVTTNKDYQTSIVIKIYEGKAKQARDNKLLGVFSLKVPRELKGVPKVLVTFDMDQSGMLEVKAEDTTRGINKKIQITKGTR